MNPRNRGRWLVVLLAAGLSGSTCQHELPQLPRLPQLGPPELVDVSWVAPTIELDLRYVGYDNFVGAPIDGYAAPRCWLLRPAAEALAKVERDLRAEGLGLRVFDCYRPQRAVDHFVRWANDLSDQRTKPRYYPHVEKSALFDEGYIARRSGHSRGATVDLTLVRAADGTPLDMGSPFDFFDPVSHTESPDVTDVQHYNRLRLRAAMEARGFVNYPQEWWHYTLEREPFPDRYLDVEIR
jgi:D-alanyl-D-alanine dipeptidase